MSLAFASTRRTGVVLALCAGTIVVWGVTRASLSSALSQRTQWPADADAVYLPQSRALRLLSLGHHEMAADLVSARAYVYFGGQLASHGHQRGLHEALTAAIDLDPRFHRLYLRGAAMLVYSGQTMTLESFLAANQILERGAQEFPGDWELPFQRGFNLLFEMPKLAGEDDPRVGDWRQQGVDCLTLAAHLDGAPPWLPNLAARMLTKQGGEELAIRHLEQTFAVTGDAKTRDEIARRLIALGQQSRTAELATAASRLTEEIALRYPYAPEAFSLVAGPRQFLDAATQPAPQSPSRSPPSPKTTP